MAIGSRRWPYVAFPFDEYHSRWLPAATTWAARFPPPARRSFAAWVAATVELRRHPGPYPAWERTSPVHTPIKRPTYVCLRESSAMESHVEKSGGNQALYSIEQHRGRSLPADDSLHWSPSAVGIGLAIRRCESAWKAEAHYIGLPNIPLLNPAGTKKRSV